MGGLMRSLPLCLQVTLAGLLFASAPGVAQQPSPAPPSAAAPQQTSPTQPSAAAPQALPSPTTSSVLADQPTTAEAQKLAPVAPPPFAPAADKLPVDQLKVPRGFKLEVYASGMVNARSRARRQRNDFRQYPTARSYLRDNGQGWKT